MSSSLSLSRSFFIFSGFACFAPEPAKSMVEIFGSFFIVSLFVLVGFCLLVGDVVSCR